MSADQGQTSLEFLLLLAAMLVTLAGILAYFVASSSSMGSSVSGEVENARQEASNILKSESSLPLEWDRVLSTGNTPARFWNLSFEFG
jgi:uncharacterized protein (UPF0333 family)